MEKEQSHHSTTLFEHSKDSELQSQNERIRNYLLLGGSLTSLEGLRLFECWSLSQRVFDLRRKGLPIETEMIPLESGKRVARYYLKTVR